MSGFGRSDRVRTCGIEVPNFARYQLRHTPIDCIFETICRRPERCFFGQSLHFGRIRTNSSAFNPESNAFGDRRCPYYTIPDSSCQAFFIESRQICIRGIPFSKKYAYPSTQRIAAEDGFHAAPNGNTNHGISSTLPTKF